METEYRETAYRAYVTDGIRAYTRADRRWFDMVDVETRRKRAEEEAKTGDEIALEVIAKLKGGGKFTKV